MISKIRILIAFGVVVCLAGSVHADDATIMFPGEHKCAASSNHVFDICNYDNERDTEPYRSLFLINRQADVKRKLLNIRRFIEVSWAPASDAFFINDVWGSDVSDCVIVKNAANERQVRVSQLLRKLLSFREAHAHHLYYSCGDWVNDRILEIEAKGHGGNRPSQIFDFDHQIHLDISTLRISRIDGVQK